MRCAFPPYACQSVPTRQRPRAARRPKGNKWGAPHHSLRRSKKKPPDAARRVLRSMNWPAAMPSAYPPFAAPPEPNDHFSYHAKETHLSRRHGAM
jgi:hypothetical protein